MSSGSRGVKAWGLTRPCLPDAFTLGNATCGGLAVLLLVCVGHREDAVAGLSTLQAVALLLVLGTIFDFLDGATARLFGGSSMGSQLDSLSDGITFGLVPATVVATLALPLVGGAGALVVIAGFVVYLAAALLRLADFSAVRDADADFVGLPSPLAAMLVVAAAFTTAVPVMLGVALIVVGALMVSSLRFPHQGRELLPLAVGGWVLAVCGALRVVEPDLLVAAIWVLVLLVLPALAARHRGRDIEAVFETHEAPDPSAQIA